MTTIVIRAKESHVSGRTHQSHRVIETPEHSIYIQRRSGGQPYVAVGFTHGGENREVNYSDPDAIQIIVGTDVIFEYRPELLKGL